MLRATTAILLLLVVACSDAERRTGTSRSGDSSPARSGADAKEPACNDRWREVQPGLRQRSLCSDGEATLHQVEVDAARWTLDAVRVAPTTAPAVARERGAAFAINANFFDPDRKPLGVVVSDGAVVQRPHPVSWQSIFYTTSDLKAAIVLPEQWAAVRDDAAMAVQAGPRLVAGGRTTGATRGNPSLRSGICLTADDRVIFFATTMRRLYDVDEMTELATRSEEQGGLGCRDAMLFDGGPSAQMYLQGSDISIEGDRVPVFVIARPRDE
jgi:uncharacterized protein YigE (DUF2233 family)